VKSGQDGLKLTVPWVGLGFDAGGVRLGTVLLDHGKRVIGFGPSGIYVVSYDEFDLNFLERYSMPDSLR
jgi:hypothetical protein